MNSKRLFGASFPIAVVAGLALLALPERAPAQGSPVSERTATWTSVLCTLVPVTAGAVLWAAGSDGFGSATSRGALVDLGMLAGPSAGHFYAREPGRAFLGIGIRAAGFGVSKLATGSSGASGAPSNAIITLGLGVVVASAMADVAGAKNSARRHNERVGRQSIWFTPTFDVADRSVGLRLYLIL